MGSGSAVTCSRSMCTTFAQPSPNVATNNQSATSSMAYATCFRHGDGGSSLEFTLPQSARGGMHNLICSPDRRNTWAGGSFLEFMVPPEAPGRMHHPICSFERLNTRTMCYELF